MLVGGGKGNNGRLLDRGRAEAGSTLWALTSTELHLVRTDGLTPSPGSPAELEAFDRLQRGFPAQYRRVFADPKAERTVVVVPSLSLDPDELSKISGVVRYEERMLCLLMLLRMPRTQVVYVTSLPVDPAIVDYYLHLLPGVPSGHARSRLTMVTFDDPSITPLSRKILNDPERLDLLRKAIRIPESAHMTCFNSTVLERTLAVQLGIPMYASDPRLSDLGNKTESRSVLRQAGLVVPDGFEGLWDRSDVVEAIVGLHRRNPDLRRAMVKLNDGFSGEGNAIITLEGLSDATDPRREAGRRLDTELTFIAPDETSERFLEKIGVMGGIVEALIEGDLNRSPSVQVRIDPLGTIHLVSTHDQVLGGVEGQVFEGCTFPADRDYRDTLHDAGRRVGRILADRGVIGRFGVDFVSVRRSGTWHHSGIEINLRKGGTTLPYLMLEFLTNGTYDPDTGVFRTPTGAIRSYYATDNLVRDAYRGLSPAEMIDMALLGDAHYDAAAQQGLVFHLMGAITDHGKLGMVSIAEDTPAALTQYETAVRWLDRTAEERQAARHRG